MRKRGWGKISSWILGIAGAAAVLLFFNPFEGSDTNWGILFFIVVPVMLVADFLTDRALLYLELKHGAPDP